MSVATSFHVFSKGGLILYSNGKLEGAALNRLVTEHLLEERADHEVVIGSYAMRWKVDNHNELVFVVASPAVLQLRHTEDLLERLFRRCSKEIGKNVEQTYNFDALFAASLQKAERKAESAKETRSFDEAASKENKSVAAVAAVEQGERKQKKKKRRKFFFLLLLFRIKRPSDLCCRAAEEVAAKRRLWRRERRCRKKRSSVDCSKNEEAEK
jgi:hypothetical protein